MTRQQAVLHQALALQRGCPAPRLERLYADCRRAFLAAQTPSTANALNALLLTMACERYEVDIEDGDEQQIRWAYEVPDGSKTCQTRIGPVSLCSLDVTGRDATGRPACAAHAAKE